MENASVITWSDIKSFESSSVLTGQTHISPVQNIENPILRSLIGEGGETFFHYITWLGLSHETRYLALSSRHHFYYDLDDLRDIRLLINLKMLNQIRHLDSFLHIVFNILPPYSNFIGCFSGGKSQKKNGSHVKQSSSLYDRFINLLDPRTDRPMSNSEVSDLLDSHGFNIVDMTGINGMTYFSAQKKRNSGE